MRLERLFEFAIEMTDIGRGAAHVESDYLFEASGLGYPGHADYAASGTGENGVFAMKKPRIRQAPAGLHKHQAAAVLRQPVEFFGNLVNVTP